MAKDDKNDGVAEVQAKVDKETEQGFRGVEVDPTDNHAYTVEGVTAGEPTPETDPAHKRKVRDHVEGVQRLVDGESQSGK